MLLTGSVNQNWTDRTDKDQNHLVEKDCVNSSKRNEATPDLVLEKIPKVRCIERERIIGLETKNTIYHLCREPNSCCANKANKNPPQKTMYD